MKAAILFGHMIIAHPFEPLSISEDGFSGYQETISVQGVACGGREMTRSKQQT
jgi:hypothetical protein